jgi:hypothetical protein
MVIACKLIQTLLLLRQQQMEQTADLLMIQQILHLQYPVHNRGAVRGWPPGTMQSLAQCELAMSELDIRQ